MEGVDDLFLKYTLRKDEEIRILKADVEQLSEAVEYLEVENAALKEELHKLTRDLAAAHECNKQYRWN